MKKSEVKPVVAPVAPGEGEFSLIPRQKLLDLYAAMLQCRAIAKRLTHVRKGKRSSIVSEAVSAGITIDLLAGDAISPSPSDPGPCAVKGVGLKPLLRWWSKPSSRFPVQIARANIIQPSASIAARLEATVRLAAHCREANNGSVVVFFAAPNSFAPKPEAGPAVSHELLQSFLRQAAEQRLPVLFVWQCGKDDGDLLSIAEQCGVPAMAVDCDDAVAVYRVAFESLSHARHGNGPTLIDSRPWRMTGGSPKKRGARDSIGKMEAYLVGKGIAFKPIKNRVLKEVASGTGH